MKVKAIANLYAGKGKVKKQWGLIEKLLSAAFEKIEFETTRRSGEAVEITRRAVMDGFSRVLAIGGDGTINEVVNGIFCADLKETPQVEFSFLTLGTGGDFQKSFDLPQDLKGKIDSIATSGPKPLDIGRLCFEDFNGNQKVRYFTNVTSFGMGGLVDLLVEKSFFKGRLGSLPTFYLATLMAMTTYKNQRVVMKLDEGEEHSLQIRNIAVANGQFHGGGMWVAPQARTDDGYFDVVVFGDLSKTELVANTPKLYKGTHLTHPKVSCQKAKKIQVRSEDEVLLDVDGEPLGRLPATFEILPSALNLFV